MAKGTLKQQLKSHQSKAKSETDPKTTTSSKKQKSLSSVSPTSVKSAEKSKKTPVVVPTITKPILKSTEADDVSKEEEYASNALSKKEQRKLKKLQALADKNQEEEVDEEDEEDGEDDEEDLDLAKLAESESESDLDDDEDEEEDDDDDEDDDDEEEEEEIENEDEDENEEDVPLSEVEYDSDADIIPHTKLTINNMAALRESLARIQLPWSKHSFIEHQSVLSAEPAETKIKDIYDDTERELAFYKQALDAAKQARATLLKLKVPFSRPVDYFAEMVKSDEHMDKLKTKLLREAADRKASEESKKQRQLKKFGKQVQHETLQKRAKEKKETLEKIKSLKKKRGANEISNDDDFQIALEEATKDEYSRSAGNDNKRLKPNGKRLAKDAKYGRGGKKSGSRKNDAASSADISGFSSKKMKGKSSRPGKSKRSRR